MVDSMNAVDHPVGALAPVWHPPPWSDDTRRRIDRLVVRLHLFPIRCLVCGRPSVAWVRSGNLRETASCVLCRASNRQRQLAAVICGRLRARSLRALSRRDNIRIYNTEEGRSPVHLALRHVPGYVSSEYLSPDLPGGTVVDGVRHEDLQALSFGDASFDLVLSSDVFEHVPDPYLAHAEVFRILRPGGRHIFTVPFGPDMPEDDVRARRDQAGGVVHNGPPEYHIDPVHPQGALVYTIFGRAMLDRLQSLGFEVTVSRLYAPWHGIVGDNALVFEARRL